MSSNTPNEADIDSEYAVHMLKMISSNEDLREIKLVAQLDEQIFSVHRLVMISSSEYFRALLGPNFKEGQEEKLTISDVDGPTLKAIINFCYSGKIQITEENIMQIVAAASHMAFDRIEQKCEQLWNESLATSNCLQIFSAADKYSFADLRKKSFDFICEHFEALDAGELQKINATFVSELLKCDQIHAREEFIFQRLAEWASYHETTRFKHVPDLLKSIRLEKISQPFLHVVESFAQKYECNDLIVNEYRRRAEYDDKSTELYRYATNASKCIFTLSCEADVINVEKYNPISNRWELFRNITVADLITKRTSFGLVFDKNIIVLIGGLESTTYIPKVDTYLLDKMQLLTRGNIATARAHIVPILYDDQMFIFGGSNGSALKTCECVPLETMTTEAIEPMQYGRYNYAGAIMSGKIYVAGGQSDNDTYLCSVECYCPADRKWTKIANMNNARANFALVELNGMLFAMGHHKSVERYDPVRDVWTEIGSFDGSDTITQAINSQKEIYVLMKDGRFGKFSAEHVCSLLPLRDFQNSSNCSRNLFIN